jgi:hypothetical protein
VGYQGHDIIGCMNITFYPSLIQALNSLKDNECLYSKYSWAIKIKYGKKPLGYEPKSIVREKDKPEEGSSENTDYKYLLFRRKVIEDLVGELTSIVKKNGELFKPPLKEAITLGLKEIERSDKEFICIVQGPSRKQEGGIDLVEEPIAKAVEEDHWKKSFLDFGKIREKAEKEIEKIMGEGYYKWYWIGIVNKEMEEGVGRLLAKFWEKGDLLGMDTSLSLGKLAEEIIEKFGGDHLKSVFPEILLKIYFALEENDGKPEIIVVPFREEVTGQTGKRETGKAVDFLVLRRLKISEEKEINWVPIKLEYKKPKDGLSGVPSISVINPSNFNVSLTIKKRREGMSTEKGRNFINIWSSSYRQIEVISDYCAKDKKLGKRDLAIEKITYSGKVYEIRTVEVDIDEKKLNVEVKKFSKKIRELGQEKMWINAYLGKELTKNKKPGCQGEHVIELIKKEIEKVIARAETYEKEEKDEDIKRGIRLSIMLAKKTLEILESGEKAKIACGTWENGHRYEISPIIDEGYKPIAKKKEFTNIINSIAFGPSIAKKAKKEIEILEMLGESLCIIIEGLKKEISMFKDMVKHGENIEVEEKIEQMKALGKEAYYLKVLSDELIKLSRETIDDSWKYPKDLTDLRKEVREADELSIKLSGIISSAIELPEYVEYKLSEKKINEKIAEEIIKRKIYKNLITPLIYGPYLNWRAILKSLAGLEIYVDFGEKITITLPTINEKFGYKVKSDLKRLILKPGSMNIEDVSIGWPVMYLDSGLDRKLVRIKVEYVNR